MKKVLTGVAASALLLSAVGVVLASGHHHSSSSVFQFSGVQSETSATSASGQNSQVGGGSQVISTGASDSTALSLTAGNVNIGGGSGKVFQGTLVGSSTDAQSVSGLNGQVGSSSHHGHHSSSSSQTIVTGGSSSYAGSATVGNVNISY